MDVSDDTSARGTDDQPDVSPRIGALRGAGVEVGADRAARLAVAVGMAVLLVVATVLLVAGVRKNSQIDGLQSNGVPVTLTVTDCLGLMGGSGSNVAGYDCSGTYSYDGHVYREDIPGNGFRVVGSSLQGVVDSDDPALFSMRSTVESEHASSAVYIAPIVLYLVVAGVIAAVLARRRRTASSGTAGGSR